MSIEPSDLYERSHSRIVLMSMAVPATHQNGDTKAERPQFESEDIAHVLSLTTGAKRPPHIVQRYDETFLNRTAVNSTVRHPHVTG